MPVALQNLQSPTQMIHVPGTIVERQSFLSRASLDSNALCESSYKFPVYLVTPRFGKWSQQENGEAPQVPIPF